MNAQIVIRRYSDSDAGQVRDLFIKVNRLLAPANLVAAFDRYIEVSLRDEIDRIPDYYREKQGGFWVASVGPTIVGMFGLDVENRSSTRLRDWKLFDQSQTPSQTDLAVCLPWFYRFAPQVTSLARCQGRYRRGPLPFHSCST